MCRAALAALTVSCLPGPALAQATAAVLEAQGLSDGPVRRVQRSTEAALRQVSAFSVSEGPVFKKAAPRKACDEESCAREAVRQAGAPLVVLLALKGAGEKVAVDLSVWLEGGKVGARHAEAQLDELEGALAPHLLALLPQWARKGFGGLRLDALPGAVVKVDGQPVPWRPGEVLALPAGQHGVDVLHADGRAVWTRVTVEEGARGRLETPPLAELTAQGAGQRSFALRGTSYGLWMGGAALLAGSLFAGALGRGTSAGMAPCREDSRACPTIDEALEKNRQAQSYAATANVLLYAGLAFTVAGAGLFTIDLAVGK